MVHTDVYKWFALYFPDYAEDKVDKWFPNGKNSIRIRQINGQEFIFSYNNQKDWRLETINSFRNSAKGGKH